MPRANLMGRALYRVQRLQRLVDERHEEGLRDERVVYKLTHDVENRHSQRRLQDDVQDLLFARRIQRTADDVERDGRVVLDDASQSRGCDHRPSLGNALNHALVFIDLVVQLSFITPAARTSRRSDSINGWDALSVITFRMFSRSFF